MRNKTYLTVFLLGALCLSIFTGTTQAIIDFRPLATTTKIEPKLAHQVISLTGHINENLCKDIIFDYDVKVGRLGKSWAINSTNQGYYTTSVANNNNFVTNQLAEIKSALSSIQTTTCLNSSTLIVGAPTSSADSISNGALDSSGTNQVRAIFTYGSSCLPKAINNTIIVINIIDMYSSHSSPSSCTYAVDFGSSNDNLSISQPTVSTANAILQSNNSLFTIKNIKGFSAGN